MKPLELLNLIHDLELKWRKDHNEHTREQLERYVDRMLGTILLPTFYQWVRYTIKRHPIDGGGEYKRLGEELERILSDSVKANTLDEKLIIIERIINAHHYTNSFPEHLKEIGEGKQMDYQRYYEYPNS